MSRSSAALLAKEKNLVHVGMGNYADKFGNILFKSIDGTNLTKITSDEFNATKKQTAILATQKDPTMPDVLGASTIDAPTPPKVKKKKSLVEFTAYMVDKREKNYIIKYKIPETGNKQHTITIKALNPKDATVKAKAFVYQIKLVGTPQLSK